MWTLTLRPTAFHHVDTCLQKSLSSMTLFVGACKSFIFNTLSLPNVYYMYSLITEHLKYSLMVF